MKSLTLVAAMLALFLAGCAPKEEAKTEPIPEAEKASKAPEQKKDTPAAAAELKTDASQADFVGTWKMLDLFARPAEGEEPKFAGDLVINEDLSYAFTFLGQTEKGKVELDGPALKLVPQGDEGPQSGNTYELKLEASGERLLSDMEGPRSNLEFRRG